MNRTIRLAIGALMTFVTLTGCDSQRRWPTSTPTNSPIAPPSVNAPPNTPTAISSATPGRVLTPKESCEAWVGLFDRDVPRLTMTPPAPRGGERVRLTGSGLVPGAYTASVGVPQTEATLTSVRTVATVDVDGTLDVNFVMPSQVDGHCLLVALHRQGTPPRFSTSNPWAIGGSFLSTGNAIAPAACEQLPEDRWQPVDGITATISPPPYRIGQPITVSGNGLEPSRVGPSDVAAAFRVEFAPQNVPGNEPRSSTGSGQRGADGSFTYTFTPSDDPQLRGLCVVVAVYAVPSGGLGPDARARFTHP